MLMLSVAVAGLLFSGCTKTPDGEQDGNGRLEIRFSADTGLDVVSTRAEAVPGLVAPSASEFSLNIKKNGGTPDESWDWESLTDYPEENPLVTGSYTATALYGDIALEGFGKPAFGATETFVIRNQETTPVTLDARLANMAVTVSYTDRFKGYFPTHSAAILRGDQQVVLFAQGETEVAYIKPEAFRVRLDYTHQYNGNEQRSGYKISDVATNVGACTWQKIEFDVNNDAGVGKAVITIRFNDYTEPVELEPVDVSETF